MSDQPTEPQTLNEWRSLALGAGAHLTLVQRALGLALVKWDRAADHEHLRECLRLLLEVLGKGGHQAILDALIAAEQYVAKPSERNLASLKRALNWIWTPGA